MIFADVPVGATFIDNFDVGDTWIKVDEQRAKVVKGRESGPNMFREGEVDEIKPSWGILSLISNKDETTLTNQDEKYSVQRH